MDQMMLIRNGTEEPLLLQNGIALISVETDTGIAFRGITDGRETPASDTQRVTVEPWPEAPLFSPPAGAEIETEAFTGISARVVLLNRNRVAEGAFADCPALEAVSVDEASELTENAFDRNVILTVENAEGWFGRGYGFVVKTGEDEN